MAEEKPAKISSKKKPSGYSSLRKVTKMIREPNSPQKLTPSTYIAEMSLTTQKRLSNTQEMCPPHIIEVFNTGDADTQNDPTAIDYQAIFQPFPSEVVFQQFEPHKSYDFPISFRNLDRIARYVKITLKKSSHFTVTSNKPTGQKVAPGMEFTCIVHFAPDEDIDYEDELVCIDEKEKFAVPVRAISTRAILDFPDDIHFETTPVKHKTSKTVFVRNIGKKDAKFKLEADSPFSVSPDQYCLSVDSCIPLVIGLLPLETGEHMGYLRVYYNTGETVYVRLHCTAININIRLEKMSLMLGNTYIGLNSQRTVALHNRSNIVAHFEWKLKSTKAEEDFEKELYKQYLEDEEMTSKDSLLDRCQHNPFLRDRVPILSHTYYTRKTTVIDEKFLYFNDVFSIDPMEGDIWPNSHAEITVTFQPEKASNYSSVAFCDVTGRETRLLLKLKGEGLGPKLRFSFDTLDIQNVFVNSAHAYEVIIENQGDIEASYSVQPTSTLFGPKFSFSPSAGHLLPDCLQAIQISFSSSTLGSFNEEFIWTVEGAPEPLKLRILGTVIGPTFQFDVSEINFGTMSYGFSVTHEVSLTNTSEVPMTYNIHVPGDEGKKHEFVIQPRKGTLPPSMQNNIKVTLIPCHVKSYSTFLVVDVEEAGKDVFSLPIYAKVIVPKVVLHTPVLNYGRCFISHPYTMDVHLRNTADLPAQYEITEQAKDAPIQCTTTHPKGIIDPQQLLTLPFTIIANKTGHLSSVSTLNILGSSDPPLEVELQCIGEGPVINITPEHLDWGVCPVLTPIPKKLILSNESEIDAEYETYLVKENSVFIVQPASGVISAHHKIEMSVIAELNDCIKFTDKLTVSVFQGVRYTVSLFAEGKGTTIVSYPPLSPRVDLGTHFACSQCSKQFSLTNRGRRTQSLSWTTEGFSMAKLKKAEMQKAARDTSDIRTKSQRNKDLIKRPMFQISPDKFILSPYQTQIVTITGYSDCPRAVNERLVCHAIIGRNPHKERIMIADVNSLFIAPLLQFSTKELIFKIEQQPGSQLIKHTQSVSLKNVSPLPLTALLSCSYPFSMRISNNQYNVNQELSLSPNEEITLTVQYDSTYCADRQSREEKQSIEVSYREHPQKDHVEVCAEVYFPNLTFETNRIEFGCILNNTEITKTITMTNSSPLEVHYVWSFLKRPPVYQKDPVHDDEGVDMQSECEIDSLEGSTISLESQQQQAPPTPKAAPVDDVRIEITSPSLQGQSLQSGEEERERDVQHVGEEEVLPTMMEDQDNREAVLTESLPPSEHSESTVQSEIEISKEIRHQPWETATDPFVPIGIEQVFDVLPLFGVLKPGETQDVEMTFYGHTDIATEVGAICKVQGGPTYQLILAGEASDIEYRLNKKKLNVGTVAYDNLCIDQVILTNTGKVPLDFCVLGTCDAEELLPGQVTVFPPMGQVECLESQTLDIKFFPGVPQEFQKSIQLQVAHFEPEVISLIGEASHPRLSLSVSRPILTHSNETYNIALKCLQKNSKETKFTLEMVEKKAEQLVIQEFVKEHNLLLHISGTKSTKVKPVLPEYCLDFGYVVYGLVASHTITLTNIGSFPLTFSPAHSSLAESGFTIKLGNKIKALPENESIEFTVLFDPASVNHLLGYAEITLPFQLLGGPIYPLLLTAEVTLPMLEISSTTLDFETVLCGQCRIITVRMYNPLQVKCEWNAVTDKPPKKLPKNTPLHVHKKIKEKPPPKYFEVEPSCGIILPGQKMNIRVKFMPSEELHYTEKILINIQQNLNADLYLHVSGQGSEPQVLFDKTLVEFLPILPFSNGSKAEVTIANPLDYPVEIYSLEFDKQYLEEEEALRWVKGYDRQNRLCLPPVETGGSLPHEIMEAFKKEGIHEEPPATSKYDLTTDTDIAVEGSTASIIDKMGKDLINLRVPELHSSPHPSSTALIPQIVSTSLLSNATVGSILSELQLEGLDSSPVAACIARYLGIDISPEAAIADMRRGVAVIIYGPQHSGKTTQAYKLATLYNAPVININELIINAISNASTPAGCKARILCMEATKEAMEAEAAAVLAEQTETPAASKASLARKVSRVPGATKEQLLREVLEPEKTPRPKPFPVQPLLESDYAVPDECLFSMKLPEEIILEVLSDRLLHTDCRKGVVFDGLQCQFTSDELMSGALVLKALDNRKHIYFIDLELNFDGVKMRVEDMEKEKQRKLEEEIKAKEAEEENIQALLDMSEDEYEALTPQKQREIDVIRDQRYREKREKHKQEEEQKRLEQERLEELRLLEEEKMKGKKNRGGTVTKPFVQGDQVKPSPAHTVTSRPESAASTHLQHLPQQLGGGIPGTSAVSIGSTTDSVSGRRKSHRSQSLLKDSKEESLEPIDAKEEELKRNFHFYESTMQGIKNLLENWDRVKGIVRTKKPPPQPEQEEKNGKVSATPKKTKSRKSTGGRTESSLGQQHQQQQQQQAHPLQQLTGDTTGTSTDDDDNREGIGVPLISVKGCEPKENVTMNITSSGLPSLDEILEGFGLGPDGPPIPEPVTFQVYPYPLKRKPIQPTRLEHFKFIENETESRTNVIQETVRRASLEPTESQIPDTKESRDSPSHLGVSKHSAKSKEDLSQSRKRSVMIKSRQGKASSSPQHQQEETTSDDHTSEQQITTSKPVQHRWVIPPKEEYKLKLLFVSQEEGQFDQTLNFEIVGTRRHYQLFCRGLCQLPTISREPRIVFCHRKRTMKIEEIVHKRYILDKDEYHFGPLHCGKPRERYREGRYPENMETLIISNPGNMDSQVEFCFKTDSNASTFLLEPPNMTLQPGESKPLTIWAYPKSSGEFKDYLVCSIHHNPAPTLFHVCCHGVEPELKVDKKSLDFGKVLLHRRESCVLHLRNNTLLPAAWKLSGLETIGEEFSFSQEQGIVQPKSAFPLNIHFRAVKPVSYSKKAFKVEISDVEQIIGLMHVESVQLQAEAYDVAMDISFPKGTDGGLDFGCQRVYDDLKLTMQLKNKGKYDIAYNFLFDVNPQGLDYGKWFVLNPTNNILYPGEKSQTISILFKADRELNIKDQPVLKCQVIDTHLGEHGEVIANIPVRISARAVFSKYSIIPLNEVNFGSLVIGSRKSGSFTIENKGEFEFRYAVSKRLPLELQKLRQSMLVPPSIGQGKRGKGEQSTPSRASSVASKLNTSARPKEGSLRYEVLGGGSQRLMLGLFNISPATGTITPGQSQTITVECVAERQGKHEELLSVEISDSNKRDMPISYKVCAEVLIPAINSTDVMSIFEEHRICRQLGVLGPHEFHEDGCVGVYGENERRFMFKSIIVGHTSKARIKIINPNKIPCDVNINIKPISLKQKVDAFEVEPPRASISSYSHIYATVTFKPSAMQVYNAIFEATVDGPPQARGKGLTFDLTGEGNLPQVTILKPTTRSAQGQHLLLFKKLLLGQKEDLPIIISNIGSIPANVVIELDDDAKNNFIVSHSSDETEDDTLLSSCILMHLYLPANSTKEIVVTFCPQDVREYKGCLWITVKDNHFETIPIVLAGEGYQSEIFIGNIRRHVTTFTDKEEVVDEIGAAKENNLYFGVCPVGDPCNLTFTLTNYSPDPIRYQWPAVPCLTFAPSLGHLLSGASCDITTTFTNIKPKEYKQQRLAGKYWKISYTEPINQVPEWNDTMKTVKWVNAPPTAMGSHSSRPGSTDTKSKKDTEPEEKPVKLPIKRKIIETEAEPENKLIDKAGEDLEVFLTAQTTFAEYECPSRTVVFKDTYLLQSQKFSFPLKNTGKITLSYKWFLTTTPKEMPEDSQSSIGISTSSGEDTIEEEEEILVTIEPKSGQIPPGQEQIITVTFSPVDLIEVEYKFRCKIANLKSSAHPLDLVVKCNSLMPYCYFDLPENDYLTQRRPTEVKGSEGFTAATRNLDLSTKVIEFSSKGIGPKIHRSLDIVNPTTLSYEFQWTQEEKPSHLATPIFNCHNPKGTITGGKKYTVVFEYTPTTQEQVEALWHFSIPSLSITVPFLLVGHTSEPQVNLDRAYLSFRSMLVGTSSKETVYLINNEDKPYQFSFNEKSCRSSDPRAKLTVSPMSGVIAPMTKLPVDITFTATEENEFIFHLVCNVKSKPTPLKINIKAEIYAIKLSLSVTDTSGAETNLPVDKHAKRIIDFKKVLVNERALWQVAVHNHSQFVCHYNWSFSDNCCKKGGAEDQLVCINPMKGMVEAHDKVNSELIFSPASCFSLKNCELLLQITNGPTIPITLKGSGTEPKVIFSFKEYDFGPRFLHHPNMPPNITTLTITNHDKADLSVECLYTNTQHIELHFEPRLLAPDETMDVDCYFRPHKAIKYCEEIMFEINGISRKTVIVRGEGAPIKVELVNPAQKSVNLGALRVNEKTNRKVKLVNHSPLAVKFTVDIVPSTLVPALQEEGVLSVALCPIKGQQLGVMGDITLKPKEEVMVEVTFCPTARVPQFSEEVIMESYGLYRPLFVVRGSCHGLEISLDNDHIPFGAVVLHSQSTRRVQMINSGDIGAKFQWEADTFGPDFSIKPIEGYISPGMEIAFDLVFHPQQIHNDIHYDGLLCNIEDGSPLRITLTGVCIEQIPLKEVIHFTTTVRNKETKQLTIHNKTSTPWLLHPIIDGEHWSGPVSISIRPGQACNYELLYHPLVMTHEPQKHQGSIFFPIPDGTGLLYNLLGTADPPKHSGSIVQEIPCKTSHTELLSVNNWLRQSQRFRVYRDMIRPEKLDRSVSLYGAEYIDVPALGKRAYKLNFYSFKEGSFLSKVTFQNEQTGEYLFYHVHFKSVSAGIISTIELRTAVRRSVSHTITIDNPLPSPVNMSTLVNVSDITIPTSFLIGAESQGKCTFEYLPLKVDNSTGKLTLQSSELGAYHYELHLKATPPMPERPVHFTTTLGNNQSLPCYFTSYAKGRTEYTCKVDNVDFHVDKSLTVSTTEAAVDMTFEPSSLGDTHATLSISSTSGGDYVIPLHGHCLEPKPQGPYTIKAGGSINIPFRNIFHQTKQFSFSVDNPAFTVKPGDNLKPRKIYNILVHFDAKQADTSLTKVGKLIVTCVKSGGNTSNVKWTYYLKGLPVDK